MDTFGAKQMCAFIAGAHYRSEGYLWKYIPIELISLTYLITRRRGHSGAAHIFFCHPILLLYIQSTLKNSLGEANRSCFMNTNTNVMSNICEEQQTMGSQ